MAKINWSRVILGGLAAGGIINAAEYLVNGVILQAKWADAMKGIGKPFRWTYTDTARRIRPNKTAQTA